MKRRAGRSTADWTGLGARLCWAMLRAIFISTVLLATTMSSLSGVPEAIQAHQWKHRLILVAAVEGEVIEAAARQLEKSKAGVVDRDLLLIDISQLPLAQQGWLRPEAEGLQELRKFAAIEGDERGRFILVGKDGTIKARQSGKFELQKFFERIDAMPMRQREMRERD